MAVADALGAVDECGAPVVSIAGGEPLLHKNLPEIVEGIIARGKFVYLCTNALLMEKKLHQYKPSSYFTWSVHLDGDKEMHDHSVCQPGIYDRAVSAIAAAKKRGFRVNINCTLFNTAQAEQVAAFFDTVMAMGVDGITVSPGYAYERAPDQQHFLNRDRTKNLFRDIFRRGRGGKNGRSASPACSSTSWPATRVTTARPGAIRPAPSSAGSGPVTCLGEGYAKTFKELMEETDWDSYGTGNYEKCADCMVHSGYEASAVEHAMQSPLKALGVALRGVRTDGDMVPDLSLDGQRPADYVFSQHVAEKLEEIRQRSPRREPVAAK